jgi:hypothetical protein
MREYNNIIKVKQRVNCMNARLHDRMNAGLQDCTTFIRTEIHIFACKDKYYESNDAYRDKADGNEGNS